jgi:ABC-type lipoprotein export system ATPase subunit
MDAGVAFLQSALQQQQAARHAVQQDITRMVQLTREMSDTIASERQAVNQRLATILGTLALMSGGEQALTASALIFAVFLSRPAPICVLDEVDAPLDDANVDRFCNMLNEMRQRTDTRFVVITHNPVTMSRMDRLFGVTMREKGVSKLVSVDLEAAERLVAAE